MPATASQAQRPATHEDANLLLRLYELRREEKLRKARKWFMKNFHPGSLEEFQKLCPLGSEENAFYRMVVSYWEMAASFVTAGILHEKLFTQNSRELLFVWERIRGVIPALRENFNNSNIAGNLETVANTMASLNEKLRSLRLGLGLNGDPVKLRVVATACVGKLLSLESRLEHRRLEKRIPCNLSKVRITAEGDLETVDGYVVNVSKSGLRLRTDKYFRCARKLAIEMAGHLMRGSIRYRCVQTDNPGSFEMGVRIDEVASSNLKAQSR